MAIWGLSDLHLAFGVPEPVRRRAAAVDHSARVEREWRAVVAPEDLVLMPGDLSIARDHREVQADLAWLHALPGRKVLSPGNHDRWWNRVDAVRRLLRPSCVAVDGDAVDLDALVVCGCLGAPVPAADSPAAAIPPPLMSALEAGSKRRRPGQPLVLLWHYPPFGTGRRPGPWVEHFRAFGVDRCVYGHGHRQSRWSEAVQGPVAGVDYRGVAADAIGFRPIRLDHPIPPHL